MTDELEKDIMKLCDESYMRGGYDALMVLHDGLKTITKYYPQLTLDEIFACIETTAKRYNKETNPKEN